MHLNHVFRSSICSIFQNEADILMVMFLMCEKNYSNSVHFLLVSVDTNITNILIAIFHRLISITLTNYTNFEKYSTIQKYSLIELISVVQLVCRHTIRILSQKRVRLISVTHTN